MFSAKAYTKGAEMHLAKAYKKILKAGEATVDDLKNIGKETARVLVPKGEHGWLYNTIQARSIKGGKNPRAEVFLKPAIIPNDLRWGIGNYPRFNLARWMHESPRADEHIKNGDPKFMYTMAEILEGQTGNVIEKNFRKTKL